MKPRTLIYDLETSPCLGWFWRTGKQNVGAHQIRRPGKIICISYRFHHWPEGKVKNLRWSAKQNDKNMVLRFAEIAERADIIVGHNGDNFDKKWLNTRLAYHGHPTISHKMSEDTLKQSRKEFQLPSHKLDFLCKYFHIPGKLSTQTGMWERVVFDNDKKSLDEMVRYCDQDVLILDKLYARLYPYVQHKLNLAVYNEKADVCPDCGSKERVSKGYVYTRAGKFRSFVCKDCGKRYRNGKNLIQRSGEYSR